MFLSQFLLFNRSQAQVYQLSGMIKGFKNPRGANWRHYHNFIRPEMFPEVSAMVKGEFSISSPVKP